MASMDISSEDELEGKKENVISSLHKGLNKQRMNNQFCDVILLVQGKEFPAHRNVLAACSVYFDTMFSSQMKERHEKTIPMEGITSYAMEKILKFIYTQDISVTSKDIKETLPAAHLMQIEELLDVLSNYIANHINSSNCFSFREIGKLYSLKDVVESADFDISYDFDEVYKLTGFCQLPLFDVVSIIASDSLNVMDEGIVFEAVCRWVNHDINKRESLFPVLMKSVRLQLISTENLAKNISPKPLVRKFPECRDLVEQAFQYHANACGMIMQKLREDSNAILCMGDNRMLTFHTKQKCWSKENISKHRPLKWCAVALHNRRTIFCGGYDANNRPSNQVIMFNMDKFEEIAPMVRPRARAAATVYHEGVVYVFGGDLSYSDPVSVGVNRNLATDFERFDIKENVWKVVGKMGTPRSGASAVVEGGLMYLIGGCKKQITGPIEGSQNLVTSACGLLETYNPFKNEWLERKSMKTPRALFGAVVIYSKIYVFGGIGRNSQNLNSIESFDTNTDEWTQVTSVVPWSGPSLTYQIQDTMYASVIGQINMQGRHISSISLHTFDPSSNQWEQDKTGDFFLRNSPCHSFAPIYYRK
ncbi:kelch-like protein 12 isoform X2 [Clavelina lepadiformis]|uniref:kelch-like protein 12 isoform X2 n=1 Tax=Clavelina lepadiformis TaxID=159417 RepID=UPI00404306AE